MIQRLERYNESERILTGEEFRVEYQKLGKQQEMQKFKKIRPLRSK